MSKKAYICPSCGKTFYGVTNRRARRPLDEKAVAAANGKIESDCSRLDAPGTTQARRIGMSDEDYLCRRVWMDAYLDAVGDEPRKTVPKKKKRPEDICTNCDDLSPIDPKTKCIIIDAIARCQHTENGLRIAHSGQTLGVVPAVSYVMADPNEAADTIILEAKVQRSCGRHPVWTINGDNKAIAARHSFEAAPSATSKFWIPTFRPKVYVATCETHGNTHSITIHAYPSNELSFNIDFTKAISMIRTIMGKLEAVLDTVAGKFEWKYLEGKASTQASWKEHTDNRAFYAYEISLGFKPLVGGEFKFEFGPTKLVNALRKIPRIGKYIQTIVDWIFQANLYLKFSGGITVSVAYKRDSPDLPTFVEGTGPGVGGDVGVALGGVGGIVGDLLNAELEIGGEVKAGGVPFINSGGFGLDKFSLDFDGLKGNAKFTFAWGIFDVNETMTIISGRNIYGPKKFYFYEA